MLKNRFFLSYWQDAIQKIWNDIPPEYIRAFFIVFVLQLIANAIELTQVPFNADDVSQLITPQGAMVRSGRPALYLLFDFIFNHHYTPPFMGCLGLAAQAAAGLYVARLLNIKDSWLLVIFAAIASMHPYLLDHQSFDSTRLAYPLGSLLTVVACGEILKGGRKGLIGSLLFGLGLLFYQSVIFIMLTTMCLISINQLLEGVQPVEILKRFIPWCLFCLAGLVIYIVGAKAFQYFAGWHTNGRFQAVFTLDFILKQFPLFFQMVKNSFFVSSGYHYFPWSSKILFNLFLVSTIYNLARKGFRAAFLGIILILAVIIIPITPKLILKNGYLPIRTLLCHGFFWGGLAAMTIKYLRERDIPWAVNLTWVAAMTIIFLFTSVTAQFGLDEKLAYQNDLLATSRILSRIEAHPQYANVPPGKRRLAVIGNLPTWRCPIPVGAIATARSNRWSKANIFRYLDSTIQTANSKDMKRARKYAATHKPLPHTEGVTVFEDGLIVVVYSPK